MVVITEVMGSEPTLDEYESRFDKIESELNTLRSSIKEDDNGADGKKSPSKDTNNDKDKDDTNNNNNKRQKMNGRVKWVSTDDDPRQVGRFITGAARDDAAVGFPVTLHAKYDKPVNTSLKACAIALPNCARENNVYAACELTFRENRNELTIKCAKLEDPPSAEISAVLEGGGGGEDDSSDTKMKDSEDNSAAVAAEKKLQVGRKTEYKTLAGAIANRIRNSEPVTIAAVGPECVFTAARAIAVASQYLEADNENNDDGDDDEKKKASSPNLVAIPKFNRVQIEGRDSETNVLEISVFVASTIDE